MPRTALRHSVSRSVLMLLALSAAPALAQEGAAPQDDQGAADIIVTGTLSLIHISEPTRH